MFPGGRLQPPENRFQLTVSAAQNCSYITLYSSPDGDVIINIIYVLEDSHKRLVAPSHTYIICEMTQSLSVYKLLEMFNYCLVLIIHSMLQ